MVRLWRGNMGTLFPAMHSTLAPDAGMVSRDGRAHDLPEHTLPRASFAAASRTQWYALFWTRIRASEGSVPSSLQPWCPLYCRVARTPSTNCAKKASEHNGHAISARSRRGPVGIIGFLLEINFFTSKLLGPISILKTLKRGPPPRGFWVIF